MARLSPIVAALLTLVACTSSSEPGPSPTRTGTRTPAPPASGGRITVGVLGWPATLDPYDPLASDLTRTLAHAVYPSLFELDPEGDVAGDLARSVDRTPDGIEVRLREAQWSDGSRITADDVAASVRRAAPPSGFAGLSVQTQGRDLVRFSGRGVSPRRLARSAPVLPRGRAGGPYGGPFRIRSVKPGLEVVLVRNPNYHWVAPLLDRVTVRGTLGSEIALGLLERNRLDVALLPSSPNLDERLDAQGVDYVVRSGAEQIFFDLSGAPAEDRGAIAAAIDRGALLEGLVRDDGATLPLPRRIPVDSTPATIRLATPAGDEMLELMQRVIQRQLDNRDVKAELVSIDPETLYGSWERDDPVEAALRRVTARAGQDWWERPGAASLPLFSVDGLIAVDGRVAGIDDRSTADGPLWDLERWYVDGPSG